jgi:hypothetical protein
MGTRDNYETLFSLLGRREPPVGLSDAVLERIEVRRRRAARMRISLFGIVGLAAVAAFVPAWRELSAELAQSGFTQFLSLLFSDASALFTYWQDFALSLMESFPAAGAAAVSASVLVFLLSVRFFAGDARVAFRRSGLAHAGA